MINFAILENRNSENASAHLVKILCAVILCIIVVVALCYLIVAPVSSYVSVVVHGQSQISIEEIMSIAGITPDTKWSEFDASAAEDKLSAHPLFSVASVSKKLPDRVVVSVKERVPVVVAIGNFEGRAVPVEIDRDGMIFRVGATSQVSSLPLITGINMENPVPGSSLSAQLRPLLRQIETLVNENPRLIASVSEIKIAPKAYGSYDLVLFPEHTNISVRTDRALNADALQYMMLVLDVVKDLGIDVKEIDIRAGTVAYTLNENAV